MTLFNDPSGKGLNVEDYYYVMDIDDLEPEHHVKSPWQIIIDSWFGKLSPEDKEFVKEECEYILEVLKKEEEEQENG